LLSDRMFAVQGFANSFFQGTTVILHDCLAMLMCDIGGI
jgi:hypothetical protein